MTIAEPVYRRLHHTEAGRACFIGMVGIKENGKTAPHFAFSIVRDGELINYLLSPEAIKGFARQKAGRSLSRALLPIMEKYKNAELSDATHCPKVKVAPGMYVIPVHI